MANNQYVNQVAVNGTTIIDLTADTVTPSALAQGYTAHDASGAPITGTATGGSMVIRDEADSHGGTIRHITAGSVVQGTLEVTENGTYDVAAYADVDVDVASQAPSLQSKRVTPTESAQRIIPDTGYDGLDEVDVDGISSTYVGSGITRRSSSDLTASGATITAPAGYYASAASKSVATGSATASAVKGSVSNHSVTVTPSVTRTAGYVSAGTSSGTSVTVSASELVSGTLSITENGTVDVTNYASASVNVSGGGGLTIGEFTVNTAFTGTNTHKVGFIDYVDPYLVIRATKGSSGNTVSTIGHCIIAEDGYMHVSFVGGSETVTPSVTATSGTATLENTWTSYATWNGLYVQNVGRIYKLSPDAVVTLTYFNNN